jgi:acetolactate synthase small subunit
VKKLVYVKDVEDITAVPYVARELMLIKVGRDQRIRVSLYWGDA